jgi:hypothetical protein
MSVWEPDDDHVQVWVLVIGQAVAFVAIVAALLILDAHG